MHLATDGGAWADAFEGVRPGADAGSGVYPILYGGGVRARCNFGREPGREMRVAPPSVEYRWIWDGREQVGTAAACGGGSGDRSAAGPRVREGGQWPRPVRTGRPEIPAGESDCGPVSLVRAELRECSGGWAKLSLPQRERGGGRC
jgi:hypothetical protein